MLEERCSSGIRAIMASVRRCIRVSTCCCIYLSWGLLRLLQLDSAVISCFHHWRYLVATRCGLGRIGLDMGPWAAAFPSRQDFLSQSLNGDRHIHPRVIANH